ARREVGRERDRHHGRVALRPRDYLPATEETQAATSWICCGVSWLLNDGMMAPPFVTCVPTLSYGGFSWSRLGPTVPVVPASASVWQPPHGCERKICLPATGSPC